MSSGEKGIGRMVWPISVRGWVLRKRMRRGETRIGRMVRPRSGEGWALSQARSECEELKGRGGDDIVRSSRRKEFVGGAIG